MTSTEVLNVRGYETHLNIGASIRGKVILARRVLHITNITTLQSGRAIAVVYKGIQLINVYAPSGTARRNDRERFFNAELPHLFQADPKQLIIGGDFNCVLHPIGTTGHFQPSTALAKIVREFALQDAWNQNPSRPTYTYHSSK